MKVDITSQDIDLLIMAQAVLTVLREGHVGDVEYAGRLAAAEATLHRLARDAMMESPIAKAFLAEADRRKADEDPDAARRLKVAPDDV